MFNYKAMPTIKKDIFIDRKVKEIKLVYKGTQYPHHDKSTYTYYINQVKKDIEKVITKSLEEMEKRVYHNIEFVWGTLMTHDPTCNKILCDVKTTTKKKTITSLKLDFTFVPNGHGHYFDLITTILARPNKEDTFVLTKRRLVKFFYRYVRK